jgi:hypothetical protein
MKVTFSKMTLFKVIFITMITFSCEGQINDDLFIQGSAGDRYILNFEYTNDGLLERMSIESQDNEIELLNYKELNNIVITYDNKFPSKITYSDNDGVYQEITITYADSGKATFEITDASGDGSLDDNHQLLVFDFVYSAGRLTNLSIGKLWYMPQENNFVFQLESNAYGARSYNQGESFNHLIETRSRDEGNVIDIYYGIESMRNEPFVTIGDIKNDFRNIFNLDFIVSSQ